MKNQYVGDIGDYTKFGLLRAISSSEFSLGINWYLTTDDSRSDGRHTAYLNESCDTPDKALHSTLKRIVDIGPRSVTALESSNLLKNTIYYHDILDFANCYDRKQRRDSWHTQALSVLRTQEIVFLDPDNGLEIKSVKPHSQNGNKYTTYQETVDYFQNGASVIVYNHRDRSPEPKFIERLTRFKDMEVTAPADIFSLKASRFSPRDYFFITQRKHVHTLKDTIDSMLKAGWAKYLSYRHL